jgi:hypothetical protein
MKRLVLMQDRLADGGDSGGPRIHLEQGGWNPLGPDQFQPQAA